MSCDNSIDAKTCIRRPVRVIPKDCKVGSLSANGQKFAIGLDHKVIKDHRVGIIIQHYISAAAKGRIECSVGVVTGNK